MIQLGLTNFVHKKTFQVSTVVELAHTLWRLNTMCTDLDLGMFERSTPSLSVQFGLEGLPESASVGTAFVAVIDAVGEKDWHPFWKFSKGNGLFTLMYGTDPTKNLRGFLDALIR